MGETITITAGEADRTALTEHARQEAWWRGPGAEPGTAAALVLTTARFALVDVAPLRARYGAHGARWVAFTSPHVASVVAWRAGLLAVVSTGAADYLDPAAGDRCRRADGTCDGSCVRLTNAELAERVRHVVRVRAERDRLAPPGHAAEWQHVEREDGQRVWRRERGITAAELRARAGWWQ